MSGREARKREDRSAYAAIVFYAFTVGFALAGFTLAAYGRTLPGACFGVASSAAGVLSFLAARASIRWRRLAHELEATR